MTRFSYFTYDKPRPRRRRLPILPSFSELGRQRIQLTRSREIKD
jgi:hypothetical protein